MKIHTQAVHSGDRKQAPPQIPVTTPVYTAASYVTDGLEEQDRIFGAVPAKACSRVGGAACCWKSR